MVNRLIVCAAVLSNLFHQHMVHFSNSAYLYPMFHGSGILHILWEQGSHCISSVHDRSGPLLMVTVWTPPF